MKNSTGLTVDLLASVFDTLKDSTAAREVPHIFGLYTSLVTVLKYLRRNRTQADIAEDLGVS